MRIGQNGSLPFLSANRARRKGISTNFPIKFSLQMTVYILPPFPLALLGILFLYRLHRPFIRKERSSSFYSWISLGRNSNNFCRDERVQVGLGIFNSMHKLNQKFAICNNISVVTNLVLLYPNSVVRSSDKY